jgi:hypothetical protein
MPSIRLCAVFFFVSLLPAKLLAQESQAFFDAPVLVLSSAEAPYSHLLRYSANASIDVLGDATDPN